MATWRWADLSSVSKPPAPVAAGNPVAYPGPGECSDPQWAGTLDSSGCPSVAKVAYRGDDGTLWELSLYGQWQCHNLCAAANPAAPIASNGPTAYMSSRNGPAVTYVCGGAIYQLTMPSSVWLSDSISNNDGTRPAAMVAAGRAFGYWDSVNKVDRVVYLGNDSGIYELSNQNGTWVSNPLLTSSEGVPTVPEGNPFGYCYNVPRVIFRGGDQHIYEGHPESSGWKWADLTKVSGGAPQAQSDPSAYVFGVARVIYTDIDGQIIELALEPSGWKHGNLSTNDKSAKPAPTAAGTLFGYVTSDNIPRVIYRGTDGHIYELHSDKATNYFWQLGDLSKIANATSPDRLAAGDPYGYEITDNIPRVVYRATNGHIHELALY